MGFCFFIFKGKRVDTIQKQWQQIFMEAAWHQPSVILFDDLDQVLSAPSALQEMGGETLYKHRLTQGEMVSRMILGKRPIFYTGHQLFQKNVSCTLIVISVA